MMGIKCLIKGHKFDRTVGFISMGMVSGEMEEGERTMCSVCGKVKPGSTIYLKSRGNEK